MSKFTCGPWSKCYQGFHVEDSEGKPVVMVQNQGFSVGAKRWERTEEECIANAHLISAAPDLLEAIELLLKIEDGPDEQNAVVMNTMKAYAKMREAVKKARGGS